MNLAGATVSTNGVTGLYKSLSTISTALLQLINNDYIGGTLASVTNAAALTSASTGLYVATTGSLGTMTNSGTLGGVQFGVNNRGQIGLFTNSGLITNNYFTALWNQGSIGQLVNTGTISNSSWAILNTGTLSTLTNSGVIAGAGNAIQNNALMTLIDNSGTMSGQSNALAGTFGTIINSGVIKGQINSNGGSVGTIIGGSNGTVGTFTGFNGVSQGTIGASGNLTFASGALLLNDTILAKSVAPSTVTIFNTGAGISLSTIVNVDANFRQSAGSLNLGNSGGLVVTQAANFSGGTITSGANGFSANATYLKGATGGTLVSGGVGSSYAGVSIVTSGGFTGLSFGSATSGTNLLLSANNIYVGDTQASITNSGSISGVTWAMYVANTGSIGTATNSGTLTGVADGLSNNGRIASLSNSGLISGGQKGLGNQGTITSLTNTSTGTILGGTAAGLQNDTSIGTLTNAGLISSGSAGFASYGALGLLSNSGSINGGPQGIYLDGNSNTGTINNTGTITAGQTAVQAGGTLGSLVNSGFIGNATNAVNVTGSLTSLVNQAGGTLSGNNVIYISGSLGGLSNSGVIKGKIDNQTANNLTISGGAAGTTGTLTGTSGIGTINNTLSNLVFASGNLLLNDRIIATGRTVSNTGANLSLSTNISITGAFSQSAGTLSLTPGVSSLAVSGAVAITGGTVAASLSSTGNYLANTYTLLSGSSLNLTGSTIAINSITGLSRSTSTVSNTLSLTVNNDYVGGSLGTLNNAGAITSASTGLYVATTGSIGTMSNSGTLSGVQFGVNNRGTIGSLSNSGRITNNNFTALWNQGSIGQLVNTGTITNSSWALLNTGTIGTVTNSGVITGAGVAIQNNAAIAAVYNSGTISGQTALAGTFGMVVNSGLIRGNINPSGGVIGTIIGGMGASVGTFTGATGTTQGTIGASGNLTFAGGNLLLNDMIKAVGVAASNLTVSNTGANIALSTIVNVEGNFTQTAGTLDLGGAGKLVVSQAANFSGGTIAASGLSSTGNYLAGSTAGTLVSGGAGSTYSGVSISVSGVTGLAAGATTSGNDLILGIGNHYVGGSLATLDNAGTVSGFSKAVFVANTGSLGTATNSGTLSGVTRGVFNAGQISLLSNSGEIVGGSEGIRNNRGTIAALNNSGSISGPVAIYNLGSLGTITNTGVIAGDILNEEAQDLVFVGGTNGTAGTLTGNAQGTQGTITNTLGNVVLASGTLVLNDVVNVDGGSLINAGATVQLINDIQVTGNYTQSLGVLDLGLSTLRVSGAASITGGLITTDKLVDTENFLAGGNAGTLIEGGVGSNYTGVGVTSGITGLSVATAVDTAGSNVNLTLSANNDYVGGSLSNLVNSGTITGVSTAVYVAATGSIGTVSNSGTLAGTAYGISNQGVITRLENSGTVSGVIGLYNTGSIGTIFNSGTLLDPPGPLAAGVNNAGDINNLINVGTISGSTYGVVNTAGIGQITNSGLIEGATAIFNAATGTIGTIANSGVISGNIENQSASALVFTGGTGDTIGTLTGVTGNRGTITSLGGNVTFASGNLLLEDDIVATGRLVSNAGATLNLTANTSIDGDFSQSAGVLALAAGKKLIVSGAATLSGGTVSTTVSGTANYLVGDVAGTLVQAGAGSAYAGVTVSTGTVPGLALSTAEVGDNLLMTGDNNYVGAGLGTLQNTGSLDRDYPVYIASTGSLGNLTNSGTLSGAVAAIFNAGTLGTISNTGIIAGNIESTSASDLRIEGGSGSTIGTLTGYYGSINAFNANAQGVLTNLSSNVILTGNVYLNDQVNVAGHGLIASGASLQLNRAVSVTGNYTQNGGTLLIGVTSTSAYGQLQVSGAASLTNATVRLVPLGSAAIAVGQTYTVVTATGELTYSGLTASANGSPGNFSTVTNGGTTGLVLSVNYPGAPFTFTGTGALRGGAAAGTGIALDAIADAGDDAATPVINSVLVPLAVLSSQDQQRGLTQLSPAQLTPHLMSVVTAPVFNAIVAHQDNLLDAANGREGGAATTDAQGQRGAVWGQFLLNSAKQNDTFAGSPYAAHSYGILVGADLAGTSTFALGGALSWSNSTGNGRGDIRGSRTKVNSLQATAYFTWKPEDLESNGFAIDGQFGLGYNFFDQQRRIDFIDERAKASFDGQHYMANLRASYTAQLGKSLSVMPFAAIREVHVRNGSYSENGAGDANLQVRKISMDYLSHEIGIRLSGDLNAASGSLAPSLKIGWVHDYSNGPIPLSAVLGGVAFTSTSARGAGDGAVIGTSLPFERNDHIWLGVQYDGELRRGFQNHSASIKLKYSF